MFRDEGNALDRKNFSGGYALYAFDLTSDLGEDDHFSLAKQGSVRHPEVCPATGRPSDRDCLRGVPERHRDRQKSQHSMNTDQLDRAIRFYAKRFDGMVWYDKCRFI